MLHMTHIFQGENLPNRNMCHLFFLVFSDWDLKVQSSHQFVLAHLTAKGEPVHQRARSSRLRGPTLHIFYSLHSTEKTSCSAPELSVLL